MATAWLSVIASSLIGPVLPRMAEAFKATPGLGLKLSLVATLPALFVAILATPMGWVVDRVGRKQVLFWTVVVYGFVGTAPLWLGTLDGVIVSRILVGVTEAAIMTAGTALISDYFAGASRGRWLAMQTGTAPFVSITMLALGGVLGERSWRAPFAAYGFAFLLIPLVLWLIWEPKRVAATPGTVVAAAAPAEPFRWGRLMWINLLTVFAMTAFLITIIQSGYLLNERGMTSPALIGLWSAGASFANPVGALMFGLTSWRTTVKLIYAFGMMAAGFAIISLGPGVGAVIVGSVIANLGSGFILPTLITWALSTLPPAQRGRGTGLWMSASFFGQFLSPLVVLFLSKAMGSLDHAVLTYAVVCGAISLGSVTALIRPRGA
ncbi:MAG: MFS transporter [Caulobacteraceae bacterium]